MEGRQRSRYEVCSRFEGRMDIVHHLAIGAIGGAALASRDHEVAGFAFLVFAVVGVGIFA